MSRRAAVFAASAAIVLGAVAYWNFHVRSHAVPVAQRAPALPSAAPRSIVDPLVPSRPVALDEAPRAEAGNWVTARPGFQYSHGPAERGGVTPCATQPVDLSAWEDAAPLGRGRLTVAKDLSLDSSGDFDLVIHLHGEEPVRRELAESGQRFVLYTLTLPPSEGYAPLFSGTHFFEQIVNDVEAAIGKRTGKSAHAAHVALSAWSAGFVGVEAMLAQPPSRDVDAVILIDGLHAPRANRAAFQAQLQPFVDYAARASAGERFMLISHSSIDPPDFASTTESAHYLISTLGGRPTPVRRTDALGLELVEYFTRGNFHVRGYAGNDKADHCAQLGVLRDAFAALGRRWGAQ